MPTSYNFTESGLVYSFDDVFVPADSFRTISGNLWTWGYGKYGQLGNATTVNTSTPVTTFAGGTNWKQVDMGAAGGNSEAIKTDGTLWTWGRGSNGSLGNGSTVDVSTPVTTFAGGTDWKQVSTGGFHIAAIKTDGTLWTWGSGPYGRLGNASIVNTSTPITTFAGGTNWKQVSAGSVYTSAIKTDGTLWTWGRQQYGRLGNGSTAPFGLVSTPVTTFAGGTNWKQVSSGGYSCAAIKTDGTLWVWGRGAQNSLGNGSTVDVSTPVTTFAGGTNWKQVSTNSSVMGAIKTDGTLWTWGLGTVGSLGNATAIGSSTPVTTFAGGTNWKQVDAALTMSAIKTDGTLWTWGQANYGKLGNGTTSGNVLTPITTFVGGTNWRHVTNSSQNMIAINAPYSDPVL